MVGEITILGMICGTIILTHTDTDGALLGVLDLDMLGFMTHSILHGVMEDGTRLSIATGTIHGVMVMDMDTVDIMEVDMVAMVAITEVDMVMVSVTDTTQDLVEADRAEALDHIEIVVVNQAFLAQVEGQ